MAFGEELVDSVKTVLFSVTPRINVRREEKKCHHFVANIFCVPAEWL